MIRLDRRRLDSATFPDWQQIATRYSDLDMQGHINNVAIVSLFQEARAEFHGGIIAALITGVRSIVVGSIIIDYAGTMGVPEPAEIGTGIVEIGRSSFSLAQVAKQGGRIKVYAETTMVIVEGMAAAPISDETRAFLEGAMLIPAA